MTISVEIAGGGAYSLDPPINGQDLLQKLGAGCDRKIVAWRVNRYLRPLDWSLREDSFIDFVDTSSFEGMSVYRGTLVFVLSLACRGALGDGLSVRHSISDGYYCELQSGPASSQQTGLVRDAMEYIIRRDLPITMEVLSIDSAERILLQQNEPDTADLLKYAGVDPVNLYKCDGVYGFFYGPLAPSTGYLSSWELVPFREGMVLRFPTVAYPLELPPFTPAEKLADVFNEYGDWLQILGVKTMENLHSQVIGNKARELVLVSEALHSQKLNRMSERITAGHKKRLICISGPSGSGKTTTAERLSIHLRAMGARPLAISLDDYFLDREKTPRDPEGNYDFEAIEAMDLELINVQLEDLLEGREVTLPRFNFLTGKREEGSRVRMGSDDILIIEGIHGLNNRITSHIPADIKFSIYISPLTGISLDRHNRTSTTDNRLLRRLVRDRRLRGKSASTTLAQWPSVIRGAHRYIFPYQELADEMFNSALFYELSVLKGYAEPMLRTVREDSPEFGEAARLLNILRFIPYIPSDYVPSDSILREFIGGGCFE
ncbi:MAG TPA: nucleoside kinase [Synergistales bacterium]|nr:nucleoside kinase [Synergistales bacterium]HQO83488.1 nucleoside kinase [Synergistales bacterium]HQQ10391.1 nucleoside kinase [Synergistales bacterium]